MYPSKFNSPVEIKRRFSYLILLVIPLALVMTPAIVAELRTPAGTEWSGILVRNTADTNVYLSLVEQVRQGNLLVRNLYTPEPHPPFQIRPTYMLIGLAGRLIPLRNALLIEAARFFSSLLLLGGILAVAHRLFETPGERILGFIFIALASGLDWLRPLNAPGLVGPESSTVGTLLAPPHFALSLLVLIVTLFSISSILHLGGGLRMSILAGGGSLFLGFEHPFDLLPLSVAAAFTFLWSVWKKQLMVLKLLYLAPPIVGILVSTGTQLFLIRMVPAYNQWNQQSLFLSPPLLPHLLTLGVASVLAIAGAKGLYKKTPTLTVLLATYAVVAFVCSRLPFSVQWRFMEGVPLCFTILGAYGIMHIRRWLLEQHRWPAVFTVLVFGLALPTTFLILSQDVGSVLPGLAPQYMPKKLLEGMTAVRDIVPPDEAILVSEFTGNFIPAHSGRSVFIGHRVQTARFAERRMYALRLFQDADPEMRRKNVVNTGARWLFWGPSEKQFWRINPDQEPYLRKVYGNTICFLYKIE